MNIRTAEQNKYEQAEAMKQNTCGHVIMKYITTLLITTLVAATGVEAKPLKVFILAGQSNMEGHAEVRTFDYIGKDPLTAPILKEMRGPDGAPLVLMMAVPMARVWGN